MEKISIDRKTNDFCMQPLYLFGTYKDDGTPNFGLFCWFSYCWDGELCVMTCIGGEKLTKDIIRSKGVFSANLVTEELLPLADYLGNKEGYDQDKMKKYDIKTTRGEVLNVPILADSPWSFELEVKQSVPLDDSEIFICSIRNIVADKRLLDKEQGTETLENNIAKPVLTTVQTYFSLGGKIGEWGQWKA